MITSIRYLVKILFGIIEFFLGLRILLKLFGASTTAPFVTWVYDLTQPMIRPFAGIFPSPDLGARFVIDIAALLALIIYSFVAWLVDRGLSVAQHGPRTQRVVHARETDHYHEHDDEMM